MNNKIIKTIITILAFPAIFWLGIMAGVWMREEGIITPEADQDGAEVGEGAISEKYWEQENFDCSVLSKLGSLGIIEVQDKDVEHGFCRLQFNKPVRDVSCLMLHQGDGEEGATIIWYTSGDASMNVQFIGPVEAGDKIDFTCHVKE